MYYFNARFYDATTGRFINVDPIQDGSNWYVYCNNNPLSIVDPTGLEDENIVDQAKEVVGEAADKAQEVVTDVTEFVTDTATKAVETVTDAVETSIDAIQRAADAVVTTAKDVQKAMQDELLGTDDIKGLPDGKLSEGNEDLGLIVDVAIVGNIVSTKGGPIAGIAYGLFSGKLSNETGSSFGDTAVDGATVWLSEPKTKQDAAAQNLMDHRMQSAIWY